MTDLTEYVEDAARALRADEWPTGADFDVLTPLQQHTYRQAVTPVVAAVAPLIERDARAAALEEAAGECRTERRWQTEREDRRLPPDSVKARMFVLENLLRDRAQDIREGR